MGYDAAINIVASTVYKAMRQSFDKNVDNFDKNVDTDIGQNDKNINMPRPRVS